MEINLANHKLCNGCQACRVACPQRAIKMMINDEGFLYPLINKEICIKCHKCEKTCPIINSIVVSKPLGKAIAAKTMNERIRLSSSSGGVFTYLAEYIFSKGGVVVGASFSEDYHTVRHILINSFEDMHLLRGSKYLQSDIGDIYSIVESKLLENKYVLFSGTGCQIAGLRNFLKKEYDNLLLVDVVCHGVPSQELWSKYLGMIEKKHNSKAYNVNFRYKKIAWKDKEYKALFGDNVYFKELKDDPYLEVFQRNLSLRESCYNCIYKSTSGIADISIGDLWGADEIVPDINDGKGISFVLINSKKGVKAIEAIKKHLVIREIDLADAIAHNRNIANATVMPEHRKHFFDDLQKEPIETVLERYTAVSNKEKIKRTLEELGLLDLIKHILHKEKVILDKNLEYGLLVLFRNTQ